MTKTDKNQTHQSGEIIEPVKSNLPEAEARRHILEQASDLFGHLGVHKTTISDVAKASGFSTANVHRLFGTKTDLRHAVCDAFLRARTDEAEQAIALHETADEQVIAMTWTVYNSTVSNLEDRAEIHEMAAIACLERWPPVTAYRARLQDLWRRIIRKGLADGDYELDDPEQAVRFLHMASVSLFHPLIVSEFRGKADEPKVKDFLALADSVLNAPTRKTDTVS